MSRRSSPGSIAYDDMLERAREIYAAERDRDLSALDVRHLLEERLGLPFDGLLHRNAETTAAFKSLDAGKFDFNSGRSRGEWVLSTMATSTCSVLIHQVCWQPATLVGWLGFAITSLAAGYIAELIFRSTALPLWVKHIARWPLSREPALQRDEIYAWLFPNSAQARAVRERRVCRIDHLVYTCQDLDAGVRAVESATGVRPAIGGAHPGLGTHNAILSLGPSQYLEIIAPDPAQPAPARPRPFGLDDALAADGQISAFAVHAVPKRRWRDGAEVNRGGTLECIAAAMATAGEPPGLPVRHQERVTPAGERVGWRFTSPFDAAGPKPFLIDWGDSTVSPHHKAPKGCRLECVEFCTASEETAKAEKLLRTMGLRGLGTPRHAAEGPVIEVRGGAESGRRGHLIAWLQTPLGKVSLGRLDASVGTGR